MAMYGSSTLLRSPVKKLFSSHLLTNQWGPDCTTICSCPSSLSACFCSLHYLSFCLLARMSIICWLQVFLVNFEQICSEDGWLLCYSSVMHLYCPSNLGMVVTCKFGTTSFLFTCTTESFFPILCFLFSVSYWMVYSTFSADSRFSFRDFLWTGVSWDGGTHYTNNIPENKSNMLCLWTNRLATPFLYRKSNLHIVYL